MVKPAVVVKSGHDCHRGQALIETCLSLVVFAMLMGLLFTLSSYLYLQHGMITVAREGARVASLDTDLGETGNTDNVTEYVEQAALQLTGQDVDTVNVEITAENTDPRTVTVTINHSMASPLNMDGFFQAYGGEGGHFSAIPITASATMRYEG